MSGGLDSTIAAELMDAQGIELLALNFKTPFCLCDRKGSGSCGNYAYKVAIQLGIEFRLINAAMIFSRSLKNRNTAMDLI